MELTNSETLSPAATDIWRGLSFPATGPGVYVFLVDCPLSDTETMQVQVLMNPGSGDSAVVEDVTSVPTDLSEFAGIAGFQSAPVPLVDATWGASLRAKHDSTTDMSFTVRVIKL